MKDRILKFLESEKISPAEFADKIGVQRSSMSHILNGRNYPSAAFIQKMLQSFPEVNSRWLLIGDGPMNLHQMGKISSADMNQEPGKGESVVTGMFATGELSQVKTVDFQEVTKEFSSDHANDIHAGTRPVEKTEDLIVDASEPTIVAPSDSKRTSLVHDSAPEEKEIEKIFFFYKDKTFHIYHPA